MNPRKPVQLSRSKHILASLFCVLHMAGITYAQDGAELFKSNCAVCHTVGTGKLLGPDLANVEKRRDKQWIYDFIRGSSKMIREGDETAVALFEEYNNIIMPDQDFFSDQELDAIMAYVASESPEYVAESEAPLEAKEEVTGEPEIIGKSIEEATDEDIAQGRLLFAGNMRLEGGGPSCLSCHNVRDDRLIGGGLLAKDLTEAFSRLNENGIKGMMINPPFPAMRTAYVNRPISTEEAFLLTAYLRFADSDHFYQRERDYQARFLYTGLGGLAVLLMVFSFVWRRRKLNAVNKKIFARQMLSESHYY